MVELNAEGFVDFYKCLHGHTPYPWQTNLAKKVIETGKWPESINVPTGCGKTSCIDIAVYALACNPEKNPRRILFVVNRRIIVDDGNEHAKKIAQCLEDETDKNSILWKVRKSLCDISGGETALMHTVLRGGTYLDNEWSSNPIQPIVISSTIDQAGSRLLFRGYGLGRMSRLVNAGLLGYDCLWILDETHISKPFTDTLRRVEEFREDPWRKVAISRPWGVVEMTATPINKDGEMVELSDEDYNHERIKRIVGASKICNLVESQAKDSNDHETLASDIYKQSLKLSKDKIKAIAIVVNRVATAKHVYEKLKKENCNAHLMIGRMRPWDRDRLWESIKPFKTGEEKPSETTFVVTTQCLEVGADLDFEGMVSEASSLDSLRQRFGRLDRQGKYQNSQCVIVAPKSVVQNKADDFIYGDTVKKTWCFLKENSKDTIDFGIIAFDKIIKKYGDISELVVTGPVSFHLLPSHIDLLCQTHGHLNIDPDITPFLHGFERGFPTVSIVWRSGLDDGNWESIMEALPPKSMEAMQIPIWDIKKYLKRDLDLCGEGDVEWQKPNDDNAKQKGGNTRQKGDNTKQKSKLRRARIWRGRSSNPSSEISELDEIKPGDIIVLNAEDSGWSQLGHIPDTEDKYEDANKLDIDIAEQVGFEFTKKLVVRMGEKFPVEMAKDGKRLFTAIENEYSKKDIDEIKKTIWESIEKTPLWESIKKKLSDESEKTNAKEIDNYFTKYMPDGIECLGKDALLVKSRQIPSKNKNDKPKVFLDEHTKDVEKNIEKYMEKIKLDELKAVFEMTAKVHDIGKADERFQQMLYRSRIHPTELRAKDDGEKLDRKINYYPKGFRHELISSELAKEIVTSDKDLFLHLVESHHGHCRPFVPIIIDNENITVEYILDGKTLQACASTGLEHVGSGAAKRFWKCVRRYGWWGLAWLESLFILADWEASGSSK